MEQHRSDDSFDHGHLFRGRVHIKGSSNVSQQAERKGLLDLPTSFRFKLDQDLYIEWRQVRIPPLLCLSDQEQFWPTVLAGMTLPPKTRPS